METNVINFFNGLFEMPKYNPKPNITNNDIVNMMPVESSSGSTLDEAISVVINAPMKAIVDTTIRLILSEILIVDSAVPENIFETMYPKKDVTALI